MPSGGKRTSDKIKKLICSHCGKGFESTGVGASPKYCSDMCRKEAALISRGHELICRQCGKPFTSLNANALYCSKKYSAKSRPKKPVNNYIKTCVVCGHTFATKDPSKNCCSSQCGLKAGHLASKKRIKYYSCQYCGHEFWRPNAFRMKYCSKECEWSARRQAAEERNKNKEVIEKELYHHSCAYCGNEFETPYSKKIYCSDDCCYNGNLLMKRKQWAEAYTPRTFVCKECGRFVTTECGATRREFCSNTCEDKYNDRAYKVRRSEQMKSAYRAPVSFKRIYQQYQGLCGICGLPVPYDKTPEKLWSATVDHIIPLSQGGTHEPENCQLAHRLCNSIKLTESREYHIDWEQKNRADSGRWSEALNELYSFIKTESNGA